MLLDVVLRLLLEVPEFAHAILPYLIGPGLPAWPTLLPPCPGTDAVTVYASVWSGERVFIVT
jgi:hypothetical protein